MRSYKHPLLTGHIHRAPLVEIRYTRLPILKHSMDTTASLTKSTNRLRREFICSIQGR
jgi:hypothetical protein